MNEETQLSKKYKEVISYLSERQKRIFLSIEAKYFGHGGITKVSKLSGVSRVSITKGKKELEENIEIPVEKSRREGGGRKSIIDKFPQVKAELKKIIEPHTRGEPQSALLCTSKSLRSLTLFIDLLSRNSAIIRALEDRYGQAEIARYLDLSAALISYVFRSSNANEKVVHPKGISCGY